MTLFESVSPVARWPRYQHIIFDCDSTLCTIEGVDCLEAQPDTQSQVIALTTAAMNGTVPLDQVYGERLDLVAPTQQAVRNLGKQYLQNLVADARVVVSTLMEQGCDVYVVSGGLLEPVVELGVALGIPAANIKAVEIEYDQLGSQWWAGLDRDHQWNQNRYFAYRRSALAESNGKAEIINQLLTGQTGPSLLIGDGVSDLLAADAVDLFVGFGGVASRPKVVDEAPVYFESASLLPLLALALGANRFELLESSLQKQVLQTIQAHPPVFNRHILRQHFEDSFCH